MIVLAGGVGRRLGQPIPKQFLLLGGTPLLVHVLDKARLIPELERVVIACPEKHLDDTARLIANHGFEDKFSCVLGGETRQESVYRGLCALQGFESVIIHEAVRPLVTIEDFTTLIGSPDPNVIYGVPIPFTVLKAHDYVDGLLERSELINVQLPQKFDHAELLAAHEAARRDEAHFTEDASLFYRYSDEPVRVLPGSDRNIKITVPVDIVVADAIYADMMGRT
jgi:2-C-methyl-D-erythritol 4-phosphate cytidylyltransferase